VKQQHPKLIPRGQLGTIHFFRIFLFSLARRPFLLRDRNTLGEAPPETL
jgi:hypothetical protein